MTRRPHLGRLDIYCPSYVPFHAEAHLSAHCGGSEEAVIHVAPRLRALGWDVTVWASMGEADAYARDPRSRLHIKDGVLWQPVEGFDVSADREALLIWRASHALGDAGFQKAPGAKALWLHDAVLHGNPAAIREHADAVLVLSKAHLAAIEPLMGGDANYVQIQNGIAPDEFPPPDESQRVPTRAVYFSSPDRGLETLLDLWPAIRAHVPAATLDVFYGFGSARRMAATEVEHRRWLRESEKRITGRLEVLAPSGVTMRGGVSHPELQAFLRTCGVWAYSHGESKVETSCCHPDTMVSLPGDHQTQGLPSRVRIADLAGKSGIPLYAYDEGERRFKLATLKWCAETKIAPELVELDLDDGRTLKLTPEHLVMNFDREWVPAGELKAGDRLMALHHRYDVRFKDANGSWQSESRLVGEWLKGRPLERNEIVDHINGDTMRLDNRPENLQVLTPSEHSQKTHAGKTLRAGQRDASVRSIVEWLHDPANQDRISKDRAKAGNALWKKLATLSDEERADFLSRRARMATATRKRLSDMDPEYRARMAEIARERSERSRVVLGEKLAAMSEEDRRAYWAERSRRAWATRREKYGDAGRQNHRIVAVRVVAYNGPVYDLEVEGLHNFVAEGVVIHNCIAAMKALACGVWPVTTDAGALGETCFDGTLLPAASLATDDGKARYVRAVVDAICGAGVRADGSEVDLTPEVRASLRAEALRRYDWAIAAKQISDVLRDCAAERATEAA